MEKKKLGIDLDDTLNNLCAHWVELYNKDYNDTLTEFDCWDVVSCVKPECGVRIYDYLLTPGLFYNLEIKPNAVEVIDYLLEYFDIYIVTAYKPETCMDKVNWLKKYLPNINHNNVIFMNNKSLLNLDYLIDDGGHNIQSFKQTGIIFDMPHNRNMVNDGFFDYIRVNNWLEIKELFKKEYINK